MNSVPLHPALVHAPIALVLALPFIAVGVAVALWTGSAGRRAWWCVVGLEALLVAGIWAGVETGENEEHRVERVTGEAPVKAHEQAAKLLLKGAGANLAVGFIAAVVPAVALPATATVSMLGTIAVAYLGYRTGASGGELVYVHGAGAAYATPSGAMAAGPGAAPVGGARRDHDHD